MDVNGSDGSVNQRRLPNPFVLKVIQELGPPSPVALTKDSTQPATGSLRTLRDDMQRLSIQTCAPASGINSQDILKCKSLNNEDLVPVLRQEVKLTIGTSKLLQKRARRSL